MKEPRLSKAETRILEQYWKLGIASVREVLESLPEDETCRLHDRPNARV
jgi:predicted transcriptional regulator